MMQTGESGILFSNAMWVELVERHPTVNEYSRMISAVEIQTEVGSRQLAR